MYEDGTVVDSDQASTIGFDVSPQTWSFSDSTSTVAFSDNDSQNNVGDKPYIFVPDEKSLKVKDVDKQMLDTPITIEELHKALMGMRTGKAPGMDGLPVEFYQFFFVDIKDLLYNSLMYSLKVGHLSCTQRRGAVKLIPKRNKNPNYVQHARPITLLCVDVKIVARALALRMVPVIEYLIPNDQRAFVKHRNIGENILDVYSIMAAAEEGNERDLMIFLDIEKAYDTVWWRFITTIMQKLNFPPSFVHWFEVLQKEKEIRIFNNGYSSAPISPSRGLAQGSGLSPIIFLLAMSRLGYVIENSNELQGVSYNGFEKRYDMAADDTVIFLKGTKRNIDELLSILEAFYEVSGLKINYNKSVIIPVGQWDPGEKLDGVDSFKWENSVHYLGVNVKRYMRQENIDIQFRVTMEFIESCVSSLRYAKWSVTGRVLLIKSLVFSKYVYKFLHYSRPSEKCLQRMSSLMTDFVWDSGRHKMHKQLMIKPTREGGFNMLDVPVQQFCLRFRWISNTLHNVQDRSFWEHYLESNLWISTEGFFEMQLLYDNW